MARLRFGTVIVAGVVALGAIATGVHAQVTPPAAATPATIAVTTQATTPATTPATHPLTRPISKPVPQPAPKPADKPLWTQLTPAQKTALEPLHGEWDALEGVRKQKWLEFTKSFATMSPEEQQRVHERMRVWVKLTPDQRKVARHNFVQAKTIAPHEKSATWESYQQLPDAQKQKLAEQAARKPLTNLPPTRAAQHATPPALHATLACPAGSVRNTASAAPACIAPAAPAAPGIVTSAAPAK